MPSLRSKHSSKGKRVNNKELFLKALDNAVYWQNQCVHLEEIIEMFCLDAEEIIKQSEQGEKND